MDRRARSRVRAFVFGGLLIFFGVFWLAGQAATLRWQIYHLVTHTPEVVEGGSPEPPQIGAAPHAWALHRGAPPSTPRSSPG